MSHYFDEVLSRHKQQVGSPKPAAPHRMLRRRSSAGRSIGARSDFDIDDDDNADTRSVTTASVMHEDLSEDELARREEANKHMNRYISDQLERFKTDTAGLEIEELETKP